MRLSKGRGTPTGDDSRPGLSKGSDDSTRRVAARRLQGEHMTQCCWTDPASDRSMPRLVLTSMSKANRIGLILFCPTFHVMLDQTLSL